MIALNALPAQAGYNLILYYISLIIEICEGGSTMYLLAILFPPLAVLLAGKPIQALMNLGLTLLMWFPGAIHAVLVVKENKDDKRMEKQIKLSKR